MSTHSVSDFAASLVEMAEATRRLPLVEADLAAARYDIQEHLNTIQRLELRLLDKNSIIEAHLSTIRSLEVARDDAELRFLECDDAKSTLERVLRNVISEAQGVLAAIAPLPEPTPEPIVVTGTANVDSQTIIEPRDTYQGVKSDPHDSDCATHNEPAYPNGPCDCSLSTEAPSPFDPLPSVSADASLPDGTNEGHRADPFPVSVQATIDTATGLEASATSNATPSADATSPSDPEPVKYFIDAWTGLDLGLNPDWVSWFNRQSSTGQ